MSRLATIEQILERQGRLWELRNRLEREGLDPTAHALTRLDEGPWITISRELGAGGHELGRRLSHELGWQVFDREILAAISENTRTRATVLSRLEQQALGPINDYISRLLDPSLPGQTPFLQETMRVVWGIARQGQAIIIGRGANWFLDRRFGLRVRTIAPVEFRVASLAKADGLESGEASKRIAEHDEARATFIRKVYGREISNPQGYDLVLNLGSIDLDTATRTVLVALRGKIGEAALHAEVAVHGR
jgi:cytidylate kinase